MDDSLVCGIDIGSTNVKVLLVNASARTVWSKSIPVPRVVQSDGLVTDAAALVVTLERMITLGWQSAGCRQPIAAIAITGVGEDGVPTDAALRPLDFAIPWFDRRAEHEAARLRTVLGDEPRGGVPIDFSRTAAKWRWLRDRRPQVMQRARHWIALTDYPAVWWSRAPFISETLAARTGCYDVFGRQWMGRQLAVCGAPPLPPVASAGKIIGRMEPGPLTEIGVASGATLVIAGGHDHPIAAAAVRRLDPAALVDSLGTANLMYDEIARIEPLADPFIAFSVPASGRAGVACLGVFEFAASLDVFRSADSGALLAAFLSAERASGAPSASHELTQALDRALLPGKAAPADLGVAALRTVLEASCFYARRMRESIRFLGSTSERIYCVGGWARSQALMELRASVFGESVYTADEEEMTALGAALVANDAVCGEPRRPLQLEVRRVDPRADWQAAYQARYPELRARLQDLKTTRPA